MVSHATERLLADWSPSQSLDGGALAQDNLSQVYRTLVCAGACLERVQVDVADGCLRLCIR